MALSDDEKRAKLMGLADGPSPLSRLMESGPRPIRIVPFPGRSDVDVGIWSLSQYETQQARLEAVKYLADVCKLTELHLTQDTSLAEEETKNQLLYRALRDPRNPDRPFANTVNELRIWLSPDERESLFREYLSFVDERSPLRRVHSAQELDDLVAALGEASAANALLSYYDTDTLRKLCIALAARLRSATKPPSWASSSSNDSSSSLNPAPAGA